MNKLVQITHISLMQFSSKLRYWKSLLFGCVCQFIGQKVNKMRNYLKYIKQLCRGVGRGWGWGGCIPPPNQNKEKRKRGEEERKKEEREKRNQRERKLNQSFQEHVVMILSLVVTRPPAAPGPPTVMALAFLASHQPPFSQNPGYAPVSVHQP